jgi:DNA mismatch endonuclease (patch repair protein)
MADVLTREQRHLNMSRIRARDTKPEMAIRSALHRCGFRFRVHKRDLPGRPDLVLARYRVAIFVHGCFWHGHNCNLFKVPATRTSFWLKKIDRNRKRDAKSIADLQEMGWRVIVLWECALKGPWRCAMNDVVRAVSRRITAKGWSYFEVRGRGHKAVRPEFRA